MKAEVLVIGPSMQRLESIIARGISAFAETGAALAEIRERKLWKERDYKSFDDYVRGHWGFQRAQAYRLIEAAAVVEEVSPMGDTFPSSERQARELARADHPAEVWAEVVEEHEPAAITAAVIRSHVEARREPPTPAVDARPGRELAAVASAVRAAVRAGATQDELDAAWQEGLSV